MSSQNFHNELKKARSYYKLWKKKKCYCPALKSEILITKIGWDHLVGNKKHAKRNLEDKLRRLKLLPYVGFVLEASNTVQDIKVIDNQLHFAFEAVLFLKSGDLRKIRAVVIQDEVGNKVFLSVMDSKNRVPHPWVEELSKSLRL